MCLSPSPLGFLPMPPRTHVTWRGLWRAGSRPGSSAGSPCLSARGDSNPLLLTHSSGGPLPLASHVLPSASFLCPPGHMWPGWCFGGGGTGLGAQQAPRARVGGAIALRCSPALPGDSLPPASPDLPSLRGAHLVWPPLLLPPSVPLCPTGSLWGSSCLLWVRVPHQRLAAALVVGRC